MIFPMSGVAYDVASFLLLVDIFLAQDTFAFSN
jgi:hypothetical protein